MKYVYTRDIIRPVLFFIFAFQAAKTAAEASLAEKMIHTQKKRDEEMEEKLKKIQEHQEKVKEVKEVAENYVDYNGCLTLSSSRLCF